MKYFKNINCYSSILGCSLMMTKISITLGILLMLVGAICGVVYFRKDIPLLLLNSFYVAINIVGLINF